MSTSHALRRRFGLELTLGLALALVAILVVRRERRESPEFERPGGAASTAVDSPALVLRPSSSPAPLPSASVAQRTPVLPETPSATIAPALPSPDALQVEVVDERGNPLAGIDVGIIGSGPGGSRITLRAATSTAW